MSVVENNKLIAEFMGLKAYENESKGGVTVVLEEDNGFSETWGAVDARYHTSWEWLMTVVEKIEEIASEEVLGAYKVHKFNVKIESIICEIIDNETNKVVIYEDSSDKFHNVYFAISEFIKIYNRHA